MSFLDAVVEVVAKQGRAFLMILMILLIAVTGGIALGMNYLLALAGEPRALWLMRDILGWM